MGEDVEEVARRAARRALAERGLAPGHPPAAAAIPPARRGRALIDAESLAGVPPGGTLAVPHESVVTPLARDEAQRRGIHLTSGSAAPSPGALRVAVGCDHGGFALKADVLASLRELGARPVDFGTRGPEAVDYPDFAQAVAEAVASGQCDLGVLIDGAGIGSAIAANKVPGVRAASCIDERMARSARQHSHANVLAIGSGWLTRGAAHGVLRAFLTTAPGSERHARRVAKIEAIERRYARKGLPR